MGSDKNKFENTFFQLLLSQQTLFPTSHTPTHPPTRAGATMMKLGCILLLFVVVPNLQEKLYYGAADYEHQIMIDLMRCREELEVKLIFYPQSDPQSDEM